MRAAGIARAPECTFFTILQEIRPSWLASINFGFTPGLEQLVCPCRGEFASLFLKKNNPNRPFSKMVAENSNKLKLKTYASTRKGHFNFSNPAKFQHIRRNIS